MTKFLVGDKVRILEHEGHDEFLEPAFGRTGVVTYTNGDGYRAVEVEFEGKPVNSGNTWWFHQDGLERIPDAVVHPAHYSDGLPDGVEVIDIIRAQNADYTFGNVLKYVLRWQYKNGVEDLKKAQVYLGWLIEQEEAK